MLAYAKCGIVESLDDRAEGGIPRRFEIFLIIFPVYGKNLEISPNHPGDSAISGQQKSGDRLAATRSDIKIQIYLLTIANSYITLTCVRKN